MVYVHGGLSIILGAHLCCSWVFVGCVLQGSSVLCVCALYKGIVLQAVLGPVSPCTKTVLSDQANWAKE